MTGKLTAIIALSIALVVVGWAIWLIGTAFGSELYALGVDGQNRRVYIDPVSDGLTRRDNMHRIIAIGGTTFELIAPDGARLARFEWGHLDGSGQWVEDEDLDDAARAAAGLDEAVEIELPF